MNTHKCSPSMPLPRSVFKLAADFNSDSLLSSCQKLPSVSLKACPGVAALKRTPCPASILCLLQPSLATVFKVSVGRDLFSQTLPRGEAGADLLPRCPQLGRSIYPPPAALEPCTSEWPRTPTCQKSGTSCIGQSQSRKALACQRWTAACSPA